jgi:DNA gyrase subunit A
VVITELPYQLSKAGWIEKLAELVNEGKISGIADIRDESDREGMRVVVEVRRDADSNKVLAELYRRTALQSNFGAILLALVHGQPLQLSLRELLTRFLEFRELTLLRRTSHALRRCEERLEVVEGLMKALARLQEVIAMITAASDAAAAKASLQVHLDLSERQADAVLSMPLRRLTGLEQESLRKEAADLKEEQGQLRHLLDDRSTLLDTMVRELRTLRKRYTTPRRTRLVEGGDTLMAQRGAAARPTTGEQRQQALEALPADARVLIQGDGLVRILSSQQWSRMKLEEVTENGEGSAPPRILLPVDPPPALLAFTADGRVALVRWEFAAQQQGALERFLPESLAGEAVVQVSPLQPDLHSSLGLLSSDGRFKRLAIEDVQDLSGRAATVLKLKEGVTLQRVVACADDQDLVVASSTGRILRLAINDSDLPLLGRTAQGPQLMRLLPGEQVVGAACVPNDGEVLLASRLGQLKKLRVSSLRLCQRGDLGQIGLRFPQRADQLVDLQAAEGAIVGVRLGGSEGRHLRWSVAELPSEDTTTSGVPLPLRGGEHVVQLVPLVTGP